MISRARSRGAQLNGKDLYPEDGPGFWAFAIWGAVIALGFYLWLK